MSSEKASIPSSTLPRRVGTLHERRNGFSGPSGEMSSTDATLHHHWEYQQQQQQQQQQQYQYHQQQEQIYVEPVYAETNIVDTMNTKDPSSNQINNSTNVTSMDTHITGPYIRQSRSISTNTPPIISSTQADIHTSGSEDVEKASGNDIEMAERHAPTKPPRKKSSRSTTPSGANATYSMESNANNNTGTMDFVSH